jgi:DNA-directed RNA polymerase specialized sigma24 family protein
VSSPESVDRWLEQVKAGEPAGAQRLWERYFGLLVRLARKKLGGTSRRAADEEDVALSAFDSFCRGAERGRFAKLRDRNDLWQLLVLITARKASDLVKHNRRQKRGGGMAHGETSLPGASTAAEEPVLERIIDREPTAEFAAQVAEECQRLLGCLHDAELRTLALYKMEGFTNEEIASRLGCVPRTVERRLRVIRTLWKREVQP